MNMIFKCLLTYRGHFMIRFIILLTYGSFNIDKCELTHHTVRFLGHVISADGVKPDPEKTRAVQEVDAPKCQ